MNEKFPKIKKSIQDFFEDEDGSITRNKVLSIGGMILVLGILLAEDVYAAHRTHYTHRTHSTHRTSNNKHGSHSTHSSSHSTHSNHYTHGSHSSHTSHVSYTDSSNYGSTLTSTGREWPTLSNIQSISAPNGTSAIDSTVNSVNAVNIPNINTPEVALESADNIDILNEEIVLQTPPKTPDINFNKK